MSKTEFLVHLRRKSLSKNLRSVFDDRLMMLSTIWTCDWQVCGSGFQWSDLDPVIFWPCRSKIPVKPFFLLLFISFQLIIISKESTFIIIEVPAPIIFSSSPRESDPDLKNLNPEPANLAMGQVSLVKYPFSKRGNGKTGRSICYCFNYGTYMRG